MICPICEGEGFTKLPYIDNRGNVKRTQLFCTVCDGIGTIKEYKHNKRVDSKKMYGRQSCLR